jgi:hypothetical protein
MSSSLIANDNANTTTATTEPVNTSTTTTATAKYAALSVAPEIRHDHRIDLSVPAAMETDVKCRLMKAQKSYVLLKTREL